MSRLTHAQADELIARIREDHGGISPELRGATPQGTLRALRKVRQRLGAATRTLARNLYSRDIRLVYELIQNADDNKYTLASSEPFIRFTVEKDKIIVESNEDGFTKRNVKAICSIAKSTKRTVQGYIGEKGIGFKSVFRVADHVHVESGPFSFAFQFDPGRMNWSERDSDHDESYKPGPNDTLDSLNEDENDSNDDSPRKSDDESSTDSEDDEEDVDDTDDDGLGMVTPMKMAREGLSSRVRTRITLSLIDSPMTQERCDELFNIPDTLLLFLNRLKEIQIVRDLSDGNKTSTTYRCRPGNKSSISIIQKTTAVGKMSPVSTESLFWVVKKDIDHLPVDAARRNIDQSIVVLAFPIDSDDTPLVENSQHVFAFLPMRDVGFKFIIQADFITQANREDVVDSPWNQRLLDGVAETFRDAACEFCEHPCLVHEWVTYLPDASISDVFWRQLRPRIVASLEDTPVLRSWSEKKLYKPSQLRIVPSSFRDENQEPLFDDLPDGNGHGEIYLSDLYDQGKAELLGVRVLSFDQALDRIEADLSRTILGSRIRGDSMSTTWHEQVSQFLCRHFESGLLETSGRVKDLEIIPVQQGWVSSRKSPIYFANTGTSKIPDDIGLNLVRRPSTVPLNARNRLLRHLGVLECSSSLVTSQIYLRYRDFRWEPKCPETHLHYLFENFSGDTTDAQNVRNKLWLLGDRKEKISLANIFKCNIYFEQPENQYGPGQLLRIQQTTTAGHSLQVPGVHFIHPRYTADSYNKIRMGKTFNVWLEEVFMIQRFPALVDHGSRTISAEFRSIIRHVPNKLLGLLREHWATYKTQISAYDILKVLKNSNVPVEGGHVPLPLGTLYLPLSKLKEKATRAGVASSVILLKMPPGFCDGDLAEWDFLQNFGVGVTDDARFYLRLLSQQATSSGISLDGRKIVPLYKQIADRCYTQEHRDLVRTEFKQSPRIYLPYHAEWPQRSWFSNTECLWSGPSWLTTKRLLDQQYPELKDFFRLTLEIRDFEWRDSLVELEHTKSKQKREPAKVLEIYKRLMRDFTHHQSWDALRSPFEARKLLLMPESNTWHPPSSCIWADSRISIPQKQSIASSYADLSDFFIRILGIQRPSLAMHVDGLKELAKSRFKDESWQCRVRDTMKLISSMNPQSSDLSPLKASNIFLVRPPRGPTQPTSSEVEFAIVDRPEFVGLFSGIAILDYTLQEVHALQSFLLGMGLASKYMSKLVDEKTTVGESVFDTSLTKFVRARAYAIFRCAVYYNSKRARNGDRALFLQLQNAETFTSDRITKSITLIQNSVEHTIERKKAKFHLDDSDGVIRFYVPRDLSERELCNLRQLPRRLLRFLSITDPSAEAVMGGIVNSSRLLVVDEILKDAGVIEIEGIEQPAEPEEDQRQMPKVVLPSNPKSIFTFGGDLLEPFNEPSSKFLANKSSSPDIRSSSMELPRFDFGPRIRSSSSPGPVQRAEENQYATLLDSLINAAATTTIPLHGAQSLSELCNDRISSCASIFNERTRDRNDKVGAAGELFVFELLSKCGLPGFGMANWQSRIRKEVRACDKYRTIEDWNTPETTDIVYEDVQRTLLNILIENGYDMLSQCASTNVPTFYIEVKTTPGDWDTLFYVSTGQYERMQSFRRRHNVVWTNIYIVVRVFNLEGDKVGVRMYVDPISAQEQGKLRFASNTWNVKPL